jgi:hypothetical protein
MITYLHYGACRRITVRQYFIISLVWKPTGTHSFPLTDPFASTPKACQAMAGILASFSGLGRLKNRLDSSW